MRDALCEKWTQAKMAFMEINKIVIYKICCLHGGKPACQEIKLFIESPNWSSFEKWQIMWRAVEPGFSTRPNGHVQK